MTAPSAIPFKGLPGFGAFFLDRAAGHLPPQLNVLPPPEQKESWAARAGDGPGPIAPDLAAALALQHRRLGAGAASLAALDRLARGEAYAVLTGQQPGLFGGRLYTRYKVATAVALARRLSEREGLPAVPIFWNAADDADFDEVAHTALPGPDLAVLSRALPVEARRPRSWVGDIPAEAVERTAAAAEELLEGRAAGRDWLAWFRGARGGPADFGDWHAAQYLEWFAADGLVVVDARLPEIRRAAAPLFRRYLDRAGEVRDRLLAAAGLFERAGHAAPIGPDTAEAALFITPARERLRLPAEETLEEARRLVDTHPAHLSPNVVLRPLVGDSVFPALAQVVGPAEAAYISQLAPIYDLLGVPRPILVDRLSATLWPPEAARLAGAIESGPGEILADPAAALRRWDERQFPSDLAEAFAAARVGLETVFEDLRAPAGRLDASLSQVIDSAREKARFQVERLEEAAMKKVRQRREVSSPRFRNLPEFLAPRRRPQERELAALAFDLELGGGARAALERLAAGHVERLLTGRRRHDLVGI